MNSDLSFGLMILLMGLGIGGCNYLSRDPVPPACPCVEIKDSK